MAIRTVGPNGTYRSIAEAMADSGPGDTIQLQDGYSNERATVLYTGMIIEGGSNSTGIVLDLAQGVATVTLAGAAPINVNDASDGNGIVGNDGNNLITVTAGADSASGGPGEDRLFVDYRLATGAVTGTEANVAEAGGGGRLVTINGGFEHYTIWTGAGADTITTGAGDDDIRTGEGAGTVTAGDGFNTIIGGSGADTVTAGDGGNFVDGGDGANTITTGGGVDEILTGTGADTIVSGGADDRITITGGADSADAGAGDDLLIIDYSASLTDVTGGVTTGDPAAGYSGHIADLTGATLDFVGVERMHVTTGSGNDTVTTGGNDDIVRGNAGNDLFNLEKGGADAAFGGEGNDFLFFGGAFTNADAVDGGAGSDSLALLGNYTLTFDSNDLTGIENLFLFAGNRVDTAGAAVSYNLTTIDASVGANGLFVTAASLRSNETLTFNGTAETDGAFNIIGGSGNDTLAGGAKGDFFQGGAGNDQLFGLGGDDTLIGGAGTDLLRGGFGKDVFRFDSMAESTVAAPDTIADFNKGSDRIDVSRIDANSSTPENDAFTFIGNAAFNGTAGQLRTVFDAGSGQSRVEGDVNGDGLADFAILVSGSPTPLVTTDFML